MPTERLWLNSSRSLIPGADVPPSLMSSLSCKEPSGSSPSVRLQNKQAQVVRSILPINYYVHRTIFERWHTTSDTERMAWAVCTRNPWHHTYQVFANQYCLTKRIIALFLRKTHLGTDASQRSQVWLGVCKVLQREQYWKHTLTAHPRKPQSRW